MAIPNARTYVYEPLSGEREFRLVTLHQGTGDESISLTIEHASLDGKPTYEALSYVWGPQNPAHFVHCNGGSLAIGENLRASLCCLRKPDSTRVLWIDRVAINQDDVEERTQQVGLMADIYSSASAVVVWLGLADAFTEPAFNLIDDISLQMLKLGRSQDISAYAKTNAKDHTITYPPPEDPVWLAIRSLLQRPWFSRSWTFQEIALARQAHFYCGASTRRWERLEVFLTCLNTFSQGPNVEDSRLKGEEKPLMEILKARSRFLSPENYNFEDIQLFLGLFPLLDGMRNRLATDPRDKVFALLNIACDVKGSDLKADYRKSHAEVYAMTAKWLLRREKGLAFLSLVEKKDKPDLISWIPDFRYKDTMNFLHQPTQVWRGSRRIYNASGSTKAKVLDEESIFQLTVRGVFVGTIVDRTEPPGNLLNNVALGSRVLDGGDWHSFAKTCAINAIYPPTGEPIDLAYHRLRIWDQLPGEGFHRRERKSPPTQIAQPGFISYNVATDGLVHGASGDIAMSILRGTTRKRMFKTDTGYMGLAHRSVDVGDKIYVLMGGEMPYVMRPFGGKFFGFGGESYVHGIMDGEMLATSMAVEMSYSRSGALDLSWIDKLGEEPWPFQTEELILV